MVDRAVERGNGILVVAALADTLAPTMALIRDSARRRGAAAARRESAEHRMPTSKPAPSPLAPLGSRRMAGCAVALLAASSLPVRAEDAPVQHRGRLEFEHAQRIGAIPALLPAFEPAVRPAALRRTPARDQGRDAVAPAAG